MRDAPGFSIRLGVVAAAAAACASCASYLSTPSDDQPGEGISYYMPRQPIAVQVVVDAKDKTVQTASVVPANAIPDLRRHFVLSYQNNLLGENATSIAVSAQGLLQSSGSTATSGVDTALKGLAAVAGTASAMAAMTAAPPPPDAFPPPPPPPPEAPAPPACAVGQTYTLLIWPENVGDGEPLPPLCHFTVRIHKTLLGATTSADSPNAARQQEGSSGIFYKTELPYLVELADQGGQPSFALAFSPDESGIRYLPVARTFFARNTATITLKDGMLNAFAQDDTGEIVAASQIPADVISAYFAALGAAFTNFSSANASGNAAALSQAKSRACAAAIAANPITSATSPAAQATAYANIQAACS